MPCFIARFFFMIAVAFSLSVSASISAFASDVNKESDASEMPSRESLLSVSDDDLVIGSNQAAVTIIEYASLTCSHCAHFHNTTFDELKSRFVDTGKARFVFRYFPLDEVALKGSVMASCAPKEKQMPLISILFKTYRSWAPAENFLEKLTQIGKLAGLKAESIDACFNDETNARAIAKQRFYASKVLQVASTPSFFINGELHAGGHDIDYFSEAIEKAAAKTAE